MVHQSHLYVLEILLEKTSTSTIQRFFSFKRHLPTTLPLPPNYLCFLVILSLDIDECSTQRNLCTNGQCVNTEGSFYCVCREGSELTPDRTQCLGKKAKTPLAMVDLRRSFAGASPFSSPRVLILSF